MLVQELLNVGAATFYIRTRTKKSYGSTKGHKAFSATCDRFGCDATESFRLALEDAYDQHISRRAGMSIVL